MSILYCIHKSIYLLYFAINSILFALHCQDPLRPSTGSGTDVPQTSADVIPEKLGLDGVHDDRGEAAVGKKGEDVDEDDVTITKVQV